MGSVTLPGFRTGRRSVTADVSGGILAGNSCWSRETLPASFVPLTELRAASHDRFWSPETDLSDSKTKAARLPGTRVTQHGKQGAGHRCRRALDTALPRCPGDLAPPPSASASGRTPRSSAPASGSPEPSGSAAPDGTKFTVIGFSYSSALSHKSNVR